MAQLQAGSHRAGASAGSTDLEPGSVLDMRKIAHLNDRTLEAARQFGAAMMDGMTRMNREFMQYLSARVEEDLRAVGTLADCRDPADFIRAEVRLMQAAVRNYAEGASRMLGVAADVTGPRPAQGETARHETRSAYDRSGV